jgi:hypothetical protein
LSVADSGSAQHRDGRVRNPVPNKLKGKTDVRKGNFAVMQMGLNTPTQRDVAAKRTSENTVLAAKLAQKDGNNSQRRNHLLSLPAASSRSTHMPTCNAKCQRLSSAADVKAEQARLLTLLRSLNPVVVVDRLCTALSFFGGIPGAPPPADDVFPESEESNGAGSLFVSWIAEIFPGFDPAARKFGALADSAKSPYLGDELNRHRSNLSDDVLGTQLRPVVFTKTKEARLSHHPGMNSHAAISKTELSHSELDDEGERVTHGIAHEQLVASDGPENSNTPITSSILSSPQASFPLSHVSGEVSVGMTTVRRRGRPKGSKNRPKSSAVVEPITVAPRTDSDQRPPDINTRRKPGPGRPKGSKNKPKLPGAMDDGKGNQLQLRHSQVILSPGQAVPATIVGQTLESDATSDPDFSVERTSLPNATKGAQLAGIETSSSNIVSNTKKRKLTAALDIDQNRNLKRHMAAPKLVTLGSKPRSGAAHGWLGITPALEPNSTNSRGHLAGQHRRGGDDAVTHVVANLPGFVASQLNSTVDSLHGPAAMSDKSDREPIGDHTKQLESSPAVNLARRLQNYGHHQNLSRLSSAPEHCMSDTTAAAVLRAPKNSSRRFSSTQSLASTGSLRRSEGSTTTLHHTLNYPSNQVDASFGQRVYRDSGNALPAQSSLSSEGGVYRHPVASASSPLLTFSDRRSMSTTTERRYAGTKSSPVEPSSYGHRQSPGPSSDLTSFHSFNHTDYLDMNTIHTSLQDRLDLNTTSFGVGSRGLQRKYQSSG